MSGHRAPDGIARPCRTAARHHHHGARRAGHARRRDATRRRRLPSQAVPGSALLAAIESVPFRRPLRIVQRSNPRHGQGSTVVDMKRWNVIFAFAEAVLQLHFEEHDMNKRVGIAIAVFALCAAGFAGGQELILDMVANKVISKYQSASCEQLWQQKGQPKSQEEQRADQFPAQRSAGAYRVHQQDCRSGRQQDVRMRHDPLTIDAGIARLCNAETR